MLTILKHIGIGILELIVGSIAVWIMVVLLAGLLTPIVDF